MSVTEIARLRAADGKADGMAESIPKALAVIAEEATCQGTRGFHSVERPDEFVLEIVWDSVQAHLDFRESDAFGRYRAAMGDTLDEVLEFAHYEELGAA